ncbi:Extracellular small neutral protease OS=Streptomyces alboniger OX=132473 GN=snpA PE=3 SV=1 [Streptomyces alboniger]
MNKRYLSVAAVLGLTVAGLGATSATAAPAAPAPAATSWASYEGSKSEAKNNKAFFEAVVKAVAEKRAANPGATSVTVVYDASGAPTFASQIASSASIWNSAVSNVKLQAGTSGASFEYREGNDPRGSYASSDGHGNGYVFLDYAQNEEYDATRVTTHETGHVLGLPDTYDGPCSQLMSGGGPGPSCTNAQPDATERAKVDQLWANGFAEALRKAGAGH